VDVPVAVDQSIRDAPDPLRLPLASSADIAVLTVAALGGVRRALRVAESCALPCVVSGSLESSIGTAGGLALAELLGVEPPAAGVCAVPADASPWAQTCRAAGDLADPALLVVGLQADAWWLLLPESAVAAAADALRRLLPEIDGAGWDAVEVAAGRPWVEAGTVESFVPQMLNLDLTGGVSFKKGCYPGQEIVARTQYLGKVKRRMVRLACQSADGALPAPGTPVHAAGDDAQAIGEVVLAAPLAAGQVQLLAVLQMDLAAGADLRLAVVGAAGRQERLAGGAVLS
jgi:folate-binding protein YgfZ